MHYILFFFFKFFVQGDWVIQNVETLEVKSPYAEEVFETSQIIMKMYWWNYFAWFLALDVSEKHLCPRLSPVLQGWSQTAYYWYAYDTMTDCRIVAWDDGTHIKPFRVNIIPYSVIANSSKPRMGFKWCYHI